MRLLIATGIFPPDIGGPATMLLNLVNGLIQKGIKVKIITYSQNNKNNQNNNLFVCRIKKNLPFGLSKLFYFFKLYQLSLKSDLIYVTDTYSVGYFVYLLKKIFRKKYILRFTGDSAWESARAKNLINDDLLKFQYTNYDSKIEKSKRRRQKILLYADKIVVDCQFNKKIAKEIGVPAHRINVIYNAVFSPTQNYHSRDGEDSTIAEQNIIQSLKQKYAPHNERIIMTACRLTSWKGVDQIITILPDIIKQIGPTNLLILGTGQEKINLELLAEKSDVLNNVYFLGAINQKEIINYYKITDVFILNSQYEGMSNTLLEVMQAGTPIITTTSGGNPELIENNKEGILVKYGNRQELLNAITRVCHSESREYGTRNPVDDIPDIIPTLTENACQKSQQFTLDKMVDKTMSLLLSF